MAPLRSYQASMVQEALGRGNHIVVLPTGAGKTLVSFEVMFAALQRHPSRGIVFLAPTVALVNQQAAAFEEEAARRRVVVGTAVLAGGKPRRLSKCGVLFGTPAAALPVLTSCLARLALLVLDEVHHAVKKRGESAHPYAEVARAYAKQPGRRRPKILGLTASPGDSRARVEALTDRFCAVLLCCPKQHTQELGQVAPIPKLVLRSVASEPSFLAFLRSTSAALLTLAPQVQNSDDSELKHRMATIVELGVRVRCIGWGTAHDADMYAGLRDITVDELLTESWQELRRIAPEVSPCLEIALALVRRRKRAHDDYRAIIFVETRKSARDMCTALANISRMDEAWRWLSPTILLGHNAKDEDGRFTIAKQKATLADFGRGVFNVLVATSVAEEGIDIQPCSHVLRLEPPSSVIKLIQSRGRARFQGSYYDVLCVDEGEEQQLTHMTEEEQRMNQILDEYVPTPAAENNWYTEGAASSRRADCPCIFGDGDPSDPADGSDVFLGTPSQIGARGCKRVRGPSFIDGRDYKSELNVLLMKEGGGSVQFYCEYRLVERRGSDHSPIFVSEVASFDGMVVCTGEPMSRRKVSEQSAAFHALLALDAFSVSSALEGG
mmetsp:Transcript_39939/g.128058  ORF Transcript_39939/g.128058 Transcript_39939/m.128058 type:complete len:609 (-) Transcript_39939:93-1919(-)